MLRNLCFINVSVCPCYFVSVISCNCYQGNGCKRAYMLSQPTLQCINKGWLNKSSNDTFWHKALSCPPLRQLYQTHIRLNSDHTVLVQINIGYWIYWTMLCFMKKGANISKEYQMYKINTIQNFVNYISGNLVEETINNNENDKDNCL